MRWVELEAVRACYVQVDFQVACLVERKLAVEQPYERADGTRGIVVFGLAQQQGAAAFDVAQVDVVAQGDPAYLPARIHGQHQLGLGVVPLGCLEDADLGPGAHRGQHGGLGENFGIGPDADFQVLRPEIFLDQVFAHLGRFFRAGANVGYRGADGLADLRTDAGGIGRAAPGAFFDDPFEHAVGKRDAAGLDHLQIAGGHEMGGLGVGLARVGQQVVQRPAGAGRCVRYHGGDVVALEQARYRGADRGQVMQGAAVDRHHAGALVVGVVDPAHQQGMFQVVGQQGRDGVHGKAGFWVFLVEVSVISLVVGFSLCSLGS